MTEDKTVGDFMAEGWIDDSRGLGRLRSRSRRVTATASKTQARRPADLESIGVADDPAVDPVMRLVKFGELYMTADRDGDGIAELIRVITAGTRYKILHEEPVDDMPFAALCPYPEAFTFFGESVTDLTKDIQRIKSRILRDTFDSLAQSVQPQMGVVEGQVNLDDVLNSDTSKIVRMRQAGMVQPIVMPFVGKEALPVLDFMTQVRENRTGQSEASAGLDPGRPAIFGGECGSRDADQGAVAHRNGGAHIRRNRLHAAVSGACSMRRSRTWTRRARFCSTVRRWWSIPVSGMRKWRYALIPMFGRGSTQDQLTYLTQILQKQEQLLQQLGFDNPFVTPDQYSYCLKKIVEVAGYHNTASFFNDVEQMDAPTKQAALQKLSQAMAAKAQAAGGAGKSGPDPAIEQAKIQSAERIEQMKMQLEMVKDQNDIADGSDEDQRAASIADRSDAYRPRTSDGSGRGRQPFRPHQFDDRRSRHSCRQHDERRGRPSRQPLAAETARQKPKNGSVKLNLRGL